MTEDEFIQALVDAKTPKHVTDVFTQYADSSSLQDKAAEMERMRQERESPAGSGYFFRRLLQQGGGAPIPLK